MDFLLPLAAPGCGVRLFVDDCVLYRPVSSQADCEALQTDLSNLETCERKWCMSFNLDKCNIMTVTMKINKIIHKYKLHEHELERVNSTTYLGVELSGNLTWNRHIAKTCNKAPKTLSYLRRNLRVRNIQAKSLSYKGKTGDHPRHDSRGGGKQRYQEGTRERTVQMNTRLEDGLDRRENEVRVIQRQ